MTRSGGTEKDRVRPLPAPAAGPGTAPRPGTAGGPAPTQPPVPVPGPGPAAGPGPGTAPRPGTADGPAPTQPPVSIPGSPAVLTELSRAAFHPTATVVDAGFFTWEFTSGEVYGDPVTFRMHGLPEDDSATMAILLSRVPESDLAQVTEALRRMVAATGTYQIEYRVIGGDGSLRSMEARGRVLPGPDGKPARMMGVVMDTTAVRARRVEEERRLREQADQASRTQEFTAALASAVTVEAIVAATYDGLHAYGANGVIIVAARDDRPVVVASRGFDDDTLAVLGNLTGPPTPVTTAVQWQVPVYLPSPQALVGDYPHLAGLAQAGSQQAWVALPTPDSRGRVGACLFGFPHPHEFPAPERAHLFAASGLLAQSVERAHMYETQHALARELQRGMLPRGPLTAPGLSIATRYQAATSGMEIGGDFYDVVPLTGGRVALVIGDVEGHNLLAASLMGRLRTAVHAYAREGHDPAEVMAHANRWLVGLNSEPDTALFATCCFVVADPATASLAISRAGHPPPLVATPGSPARVLHCPGGLPLGLDGTAAYVTSEMRVAEGTVLALSTDGLLGAAAEDDFAVQCLLDALGNGADGDLERLADDLLASPGRPSRHGDDVALLLARLDTVPAPPAAGTTHRAGGSPA